VSGFSAEWLALREPFDAAARAGALAHELRARLDVGSHTAPLSVVDLGCGAGANLRYLAPLLGGTQHWRLVDHDAALLDAAIATTRAWAENLGARVEQRGDVLHVRAVQFACAIACEPRDLRAISELELPERGLVTAAALLDLVSAPWLDALAARCAGAGAHVLFALTYDGRTEFTPTDPDDAETLALFNQHQLGDKGFGPALGPGAARAAEAAFRRNGYDVTTATSDWQIGADAQSMQHALLGGWLGAATEIAPERRAALATWHERRRAFVGRDRSTLRVGHIDLVGSIRA
jgi:SAM-dependent methyltransferase